MAMNRFITWLGGTVFAAVLAMSLGWITNPFDKRCNFEGTTIYIYHSAKQRGLAASIEDKLFNCNVDVQVKSSSYPQEEPNLRYYVESDKEKAIQLQRVINAAVSEHAELNVRFELNSRVDAMKVDRENRFHVYF